MAITASAAIATGKSLLSLAENMAAVIEKARASPDVVNRILLYLKAIQDAVSALGQERQAILTDACECNVQDPEQVSALWMRLGRYLRENHVRPHLQKAIGGLGSCREAIEKEAKGILWRNHNKEAAAKTFSLTLNQLERVLGGLESKRNPGRSGPGVQTLDPIYELLSRVRKDPKFRGAADTVPPHPEPAAIKVSRRKSHSGPRHSDAFESLEEELGKRILKALRDPSHENWFRTTGEVEALVVELELAFSVRVTQRRQVTLNDDVGTKKAPKAASRKRRSSSP
jgi:hypothetical protein